ncbi:MAG: dihydrofolate reductase [Chitinophagales bacterium]
MKISSIAAVSENNAIGKDNDLMWHLPDDLKFFKKHTLGHPVIMGRKTYDSMGKPLPKRSNIVLTRNENFKAEGIEIFHDIKAAIDFAKTLDQEEVFIIGGAKIYEQAMPFVDRIYLTRVHGHFDGEVFFPELNKDEWKISSQEYHPADEKHALPFTFFILERAGKQNL